MKTRYSQENTLVTGKHLSQRLLFNKVAGLIIAKLSGKNVWFASRISIYPVFKIHSLTQIEKVPT